MSADASSFPHTPFTSGVPIPYTARFAHEEFELFLLGKDPREAASRNPAAAQWTLEGHDTYSRERS